MRCAMSLMPPSCRARVRPSESRQATAGFCSKACTLRPSEASTKLSRPRPPVASHTVGRAVWLTAFAISSPPPLVRRYWAAPPEKSTLTRPFSPARQRLRPSESASRYSPDSGGEAATVRPNCSAKRRAESVAATVRQTVVMFGRPPKGSETADAKLQKSSRIAHCRR